MRELKFRAWDGKCVRYDITGFEHKVQSNEMDIVFLDGDCYKITDSIDRDSLSIMPSAIVMQYTGLEDKNGKEIYEGDICETKHGLCEVMMGRSNGAWSFYFKQDGIRTPILNYIEGLMMCADFPKYKKVGNIYENPELLDTH